MVRLQCNDPDCGYAAALGDVQEDHQRAREDLEAANSRRQDVETELQEVSDQLTSLTREVDSVLKAK